MGVYIVSSKTIDRIITYLRQQYKEIPFRTYFPELGKYYNNANKLGTELLKMNTEAVNHPCQENELPEYNYNLVQTNKIQAYKSVKCFLYQCTEGNIPEKKIFKEIRKIKNRIGAAIVEDLPDYALAEWG